MRKRITLMLFFLAVMMSVIGVSDQNRALAAIREKTIYDGSVETLIEDVISNSEFWSSDKIDSVCHGKQYFVGKTDKRRRCAVYVGKSKSNYITFTLGDNNSVAYAHAVSVVTGRKKADDSLSVPDPELERMYMRGYMEVQFILNSIGMTPKETLDTIKPLLDWFKTTWAKTGSKTMYGYCSKTNKDICVTIKYEIRGNDFRCVSHVRAV